MKADVAIVGGGPGGSACAIHLAKLGRSALIVEREAFPRFHIGESLTEQSGSQLREMGFEGEMMARRHPVKYGVAIYGPSGYVPFWIPIMKRDPVLGLQDSFAWQVRRSEFDGMLLDRARDSGARVVSGRATKPLFDDSGAIRGLAVQTDAGDVDVECGALIDASGQNTFFANIGLIGPKERGRYAHQVAIFSHFTGVVRDPGEKAGNTLVFFQQRHFWAWFIPLDDRVTSIGFVIPVEYFKSRQESTHEFLVRELREFNKELARRTTNVEIVEEVRAISNYSYHVRNFSGKGWLCVGDAHRFIDPLFSFGVGNALSEAKSAASRIDAYLNGTMSGLDRPFLPFEQWSEQGTDACQTVLDGFWENTLAWGLLLTRHKEDIIDLLAGRVWEGRDYAALMSMRDMLAESRQAASMDGAPPDAHV